MGNLPEFQNSSMFLHQLHLGTHFWYQLLDLFSIKHQEAIIVNFILCSKTWFYPPYRFMQESGIQEHDVTVATHWLRLKYYSY